jgi:hypothetical protein
MRSWILKKVKVCRRNRVGQRIASTRAQTCTTQEHRSFAGRVAANVIGHVYMETIVVALNCSLKTRKHTKKERRIHINTWG